MNMTCTNQKYFLTLSLIILLSDSYEFCIKRYINSLKFYKIGPWPCTPEIVAIVRAAFGKAPSSVGQV